MVHVKSEGEQLELGDILTLKFEPTVDVDRLNCKAFGTLKPPVNSNGSEELSQAVSDNVLANLNYSNNANSGEDSTKNHMPSSGVDINSNSANVQTDINSNLITNTTPASVENKTTCISGIDPAELAAYINELSLAQANNTLAYWLSQLQIQNIPLPDGDPQQVDQIQVQDISLPEGSSQPVQQPVFVPMSLSQSMSVPLENLGNNAGSTVLPKTVSNDATESVLKPDCVVSSVPVLSSDKIVTDIKPEIKVESTVREKTPPPPGFQAKVTEQNKSSKNEDVFGQKNQGQDHLENIKKENKDETVTMDNKDMESKNQKSKSYIREAKLNVSCLSPKLVESSLTPKLNVTSHSQFERETIESEGALDKEKITTGIEVHEYIGSAVSKKAERSLNDVDDSSDEDEWTEGPDECKQEPEQESLKVSEVCENKAENDSKLKQSTACSRSETLPSVESSESKQTENNVSQCEEESAKCASVTNSEKNSVKSYVNEVIESIELNREETRQIEAPKPLRRPLSLPRIPYKGRNLNFEAREDSAKVSQGTVKETIETTELRSADKCDVNDKNKLSTDQRDEKKNVDTNLKVEEKVDMAATLPDSAPDLLAKVTETEDPLADNDTTSVFDKIISPEKQLDPKYGEHDDTETNNSESLGKQTSSPDIKRKSQASDNRTSSERNIDTLISQAQWCKSYIQKTLSPKMKKKNESNTDVSSDKAIPQDTCKSEKQSDNTNINKPANTDSDKRKSESSESMNLSRSSESDFKAGSRRRVLSASYTSESWDSELEETVDKTGSPTPGRKSETSKPTMSEKSKEAMKTQASWCRNLIKQTLSPSTKKKNGSVVDSGNLDDRKMNMSESNSDKNKPDLGMTVRIPIKDVKQIVVPVSASGESWDIDGTSDTGTASASQDGKTLVVKPVQRSVRVKESKPDFSLSRSHSDRDRSVLETYRGGNRKTGSYNFVPRKGTYCL